MNRLFKTTVLFALVCTFITGCVTYTIDSNPQGLRVTVNNLEHGVTPCKYTRYTDGNNIRTDITVTAPTQQQIQAYSSEKGVSVTQWRPTNKSKTLYSFDGSGTVFFQFVNEEVPFTSAVTPTTDSARAVQNDLLGQKDKNSLTEAPEKDYTQSLNHFNSCWDKYTGHINVGQIYTYRNEAVDERLHFTVLQVMSDNVILVSRSRSMAIINGTWGAYCNDATFIIRTNHSYADGVKLREGAYRCIDTLTYETKGGDNKTVYVFEEVEQSQEEKP